MSRPTPQRDPTLPAPEEAALVTLVKEKQDSDALTTLINLHTGLYFSIVRNYAAAYPGVIRLDDLQDDKMFNIYRFILDYNPDKKMKLSSYIGDRTDYMCKTLLKKDRRDPLSCGSFSPSGSMVLDDNGENFHTTDGATSMVLKDETTDAKVEEVANREIGIEDILEVASSADVCKDERFVQILRYRNLNSQSNHKTSLSWREIGEKMGLSHERVRSIYKENLERVKAELVSSK